jgi:hypothetical protein
MFAVLSKGASHTQPRHRSADIPVRSNLSNQAGTSPSTAKSNLHRFCRDKRALAQRGIESLTAKLPVNSIKDSLLPEGEGGQDEGEAHSIVQRGNIFAEKHSRTTEYVRP